ncbi:MAG TPA: SDR family oxidoreductase [Hypericibacter adhaerens]|uniref:SDR family oxidoreductase n=1 Tax=Hypericibacter adhaerens TaxID=2602016 RepID=UPI002C146EDA|nr:SDR family oxidoreductase [Hypericibacter adhaerens]HWA45192.1 SDR family oxidoreductase [Hypericibacter adhaerens]
MDLGLKGRKALVCAASKGMGRGCAEALAREGCEVWITARHADVLEATAASIRKATGARVTAVAGDIATEAGRQAALAACPEPDILVNNAGGPPTGDFRNFTRRDWDAALEANMLAPIFLIKATIDAMTRRGFGRIVNITSVTVKQPFASLALSNGARSGLTGFIAGLAREVARHNVTVNNLLPGSIATDRSEVFVANHAKARGISREAALAELEKEIPAGRFGTPEEFGEACAFLCSVQAGYITGQNILIDGGAYPGTF